MRSLYIGVLIVSSLCLISLAQKSNYQGLSLSTPFPAQTVKADEAVTLSLTVRNYGLPPQVVYLTMREVASGWKASFLGRGTIVMAVYVEPDASEIVSLKLEPPAGTTAGSYKFIAVARGQRAQAELPIELTVGEVAPAQLKLEAELPVLKGGPTTTFRFRGTLRNDSDQDLMVNLQAEPPAGFNARLLLGFGGEEVTSLPIKSGESKNLDIQLSARGRVAAGEYSVKVRAQGGEATTDMTLTAIVTGEPELSVTAPDGRLSGQAYAGRDNTMKIVIRNRGSAPARNVELSALEPSGWDVQFEPDKVEEVAPDGEAQVTAKIKPSEKALAGDYMLSITARTQEASSSADFRITVLTSTLWGIVGVGLIAIALGVVALAVARFGRR